MTTDLTSAHDFWKGVLLGGSSATLPRWAPIPEKGIGTFETDIDPKLLASLDDLVVRLDVSLSAAFLAVQAKVLAALTGETWVSTGYVVDPQGVPLPCRLTVSRGPWRDLVVQAQSVESEIELHKDFAIDEVIAELQLSGPTYESVLDPTGTGSDAVDDSTVFVAGITAGKTATRLTLTYQTDALGSAAAARIAGYYLTALNLLVSDPDADHSRQSLLDDAELDYQLEAFTGPRKELPPFRMHELFEQRVRSHPDEIAAIFGDQQLTYAELNGRANRLARALLGRGLQRQDVVAVLTERNLDWLAAVVAIFKAGGVYLPIEPHFPADRISRMISRAGCKLLMTEPGSTDTLYQALDSLVGVNGFFIGTAFREDHSDHNLGIRVGEGQLAYIYFTSGSTGEPKGAMCEHAGMLNHLYAKIDDFGIEPGQTVAEIAPQCFDISLWQLVSALLVGGRTLIIDQATMLNPPRFIDLIIKRRVAVLQVVPSYLEVLLSYLEQHPHELPDLHCVSVTGEALQLELVKRWFAAQPSIQLANAYGLTETSDDTNHEVMDRPPERGGVPLGSPVNNVHVRVVDEQLMPVPLGAPGEIVFSGVCVGRGYINDPERTAASFMTDPLRFDERLYRSGDFGRWRPDGKLEFLGRRDAQVKIRGFRIEIGEVEDALMSIPGVRQCLVIVVKRNNETKQLVAFYSGQQMKQGAIEERLRKSLPEYMVPSATHWRERLPLTGNGKVDRKALTALAAELDEAKGEVDLPQTASERRVGVAWSRTLNIPEEQIGRHDNFFQIGGTSLAAVKVVIALKNDVSLKEVTQNPVLSDQAELLAGSRPRETHLLQLLTDTGDPDHKVALVCFPYAGGNAVNYRAMATALEGSNLAVYAVELPGHDLASEIQTFAPIGEIVDQVVAEINGQGLTEVLLWGHSAGSAFAIDAATKLLDRGVQVDHLFVGAQLLGDAANRRAHVAELNDRKDSEIAAELIATSGYTELSQLQTRHAEQVGAAYRHDCVCADQYLAAMLESPPTDRLPFPVTVVMAADDPITSDSSDRHQDWRLVADHVQLHQIDDGGHYFLRTRPAKAAQVVLRQLAPATN